MHESVAMLISRELRKAHDRAQANSRGQIEGYKQGIMSIEMKEDELLSFLMKKTIQEEMYKRQMAKLQEEKKQYESLLYQGQMVQASKFYETADRTIELAKQAESLWNSRSPEERVEFLKLILSNQRLNGQSIEFTLKRPFQIIAEICKIKEIQKNPTITDEAINNWYPQGDSNPCYRREKAMS